MASAMATKKAIDVTLEAAAQILDALACSSDPVFPGRGKVDGLGPGSEWATSVEELMESGFDPEADARGVWIRFFPLGGEGAKEGTVYDMILDRLGAATGGRRRTKCR